MPRFDTDEGDPDTDDDFLDMDGDEEGSGGGGGEPAEPPEEPEEPAQQLPEPETVDPMEEARRMMAAALTEPVGDGDDGDGDGDGGDGDEEEVPAFDAAAHEARLQQLARKRLGYWPRSRHSGSETRKRCAQRSARRRSPPPKSLCGSRRRRRRQRRSSAARKRLQGRRPASLPRRRKPSRCRALYCGWRVCGVSAT